MLTADIPLSGEREANFSVRFVGFTGDGTLRFVVRRSVSGTSQSNHLISIPRGGIIPQQWECTVPIRDGRAIAHWWFGDESDQKLTMHYEVDDSGRVFTVNTIEPKKSSRIGFRQSRTDD